MGHSEFEEMRETLKETVTILNQAAKMVLHHSEIMAKHDAKMAEIDERLDRVGRHLELLSTISDELIRNKADRKKR
jgi:hypothetical protein